MKAYEYNVFIEDVMLKSFNYYYDMTDIYERERYKTIYLLLEFYYNSMFCFCAHIDMKLLFIDTVNVLHNIACSHSLTSIEFTLLCDAVNEINRAHDIEFRIDFDKYNDTMNNSLYFCTDIDTYKRNSYYDFNYCNINVEAYIRQYIVEEQIYS